MSTARASMRVFDEVVRRYPGMLEMAGDDRGGGVMFGAEVSQGDDMVQQ